MRLELAKFHRELAATMIYVTHDQVEAMTLVDRIVVLRAGRIEQGGTPLELYHHPRNTFVAGFIGSPKMIFLDGRVRGRDGAGRVGEVTGVGADGLIALSPDRSAAPNGTSVRLGIRPDGFHISATGTTEATVVLAERLGNVNYVYAMAGGQQLCIETKEDRLTSGECIRVSIDPDAIHAFMTDGDRI